MALAHIFPDLMGYLSDEDRESADAAAQHTEAQLESSADDGANFVTLHQESEHMEVDAGDSDEDYEEDSSALAAEGDNEGCMEISSKRRKCTPKCTRKNYSEKQLAEARQREVTGTRQLPRLGDRALAKQCTNFQFVRMLAASRGQLRMPHLAPEPEKGGMCQHCSDRMPSIIEACRPALLSTSDQKKLQHKGRSGYHNTRLRTILVKECFDVNGNWTMHARWHWVRVTLAWSEHCRLAQWLLTAALSPPPCPISSMRDDR